MTQEAKRPFSSFIAGHSSLINSSSLIVILSAYLISRLVNLTKFPIFNDEAFYIRWAAIIHDDPGSLWISLVDGKTPLFYWINALTIGWFENPLISGRIISVASGMFTILLFYAVSAAWSGAVGAAREKPLQKYRAGIIAGMLYLLLPYALFNDRMATVDSFHTMLVIACLYFSIKCSRSEKMSMANIVGLGAALACAFLAKTPTLLFAPLPLIMIFAARKDRFERATLAKVGLAYSILALAVIIYLTRDVPMIGSGGSRIFHRSRFFIPLDQLLQFPVKIWFKNLQDLGGYLWAYFTPILTLLALVSAIVSFLRHRRSEFLVALWTLIPMAAMLLLMKETFSRYYLVVLVPSLFLIGVEFERLVEWAAQSTGQKRIKALLAFSTIPALVIFYGFSLPMDLAFMYCPTSAKMVARDRWQYIEGFPSGYGIDNVVSYLKNMAVKRHITVFTTMSWGNPDDAMWLYMRGVPDVQVVECFWWDKLPIIPPGKSSIPLINTKFQRKVVRELNVSELGQVYFVTRSNPFPRELFEAMNPGATLILESPKHGGTDATYLYQLSVP